MIFELKPIILEKLCFAMEDVKHSYVIDRELGKISKKDQFSEDSEKNIAIPTWTSADGYQLMEDFAAHAPAEALRPQLIKALKQRQGVFKAFKTIVSTDTVLLERWHKYKREALEKKIWLWYEALREEEREEHFGAEPEETEDILNEDFTFEWVDTALGAKLTASNRDGSPVAWLKIEIKDSSVEIVDIQVLTPYRTMGLGTSLLKRCLQRYKRAVRTAISMDIPREIHFFSRVLEQMGFLPTKTQWKLNVPDELE